VEYRKLGRFHIEGSIARGGMGEIVRSVDDAGRPIVLKTILDSFQNDERFQDLFIREAEITFQLRHPNIVRAYRFERVGNRLVLALEFLDGINLKDLLRKIYDQKLHLPLMVAWAIAQRVLKGLDYAHKKKGSEGDHLGIIHRDMNPSNIFLTYAGEVKVLDFGISKATKLEVHQLTPKNELRGKICYLAPEQIQSKPLDHRADIFSFGIVLWEMLAGRPLFVRPSDGEVMEAIVQNNYESLKTFRPDVPEELEAVIKRALSKNAKDRYKDCREFEAALESAFYEAIMPGASEEEISVFVRSLFGQTQAQQDPQFLSGYALLMAQAPGQESRGLKLAADLAGEYPTRPFIQLNYARALLLRGDRSLGLRMMRKLARVDSLESSIQDILEWVGVRRRPPLAILSRSHPLNYVLGKIRHRVMGPTAYQEQFLSA